MGYGDLLYLTQPEGGHQAAAPEIDLPNAWTPAGGGQFYGAGPANSPTGSEHGAAYSEGLATWTPDDSGTDPVSKTTSTSSGSARSHPRAVPTNFWISTSTYKPPTGVKQATPDIIVFDNTTIDIEYLVNDYFQEFGGHELIKISRADLIDGKEVAYNPIRNLSLLNQQYNPNTVIAIAPFQQNLSLYGIDLILRGIREPYIDHENGYLVVEIDNVKDTESIEVEIATDGTMKRITYDY